MRAARTVESAVAKRLQELQKQADARVMRRVSASERNRRLACTLAWTGILNEREGTDAGVVSFVSAAPQNEPTLQQLAKFPEWRLKGEYGFRMFDVAAWPMRNEAHKGLFAVRVEMRQGWYYDWADSHITDDIAYKDWWRPLVAPQYK
jgi:hypothetical protein